MSEQNDVNDAENAAQDGQPDIMYHDEGKARTPPKTPADALDGNSTEAGGSASGDANEDATTEDTNRVASAGNGQSAGDHPSVSPVAGAPPSAPVPDETGDVAGVSSMVEQMDIGDGDGTDHDERTHFEGRYPSPPASPGPSVSNALALSWVFGFNKNIINGVHTLTDETPESTHQRVLFYVSAHTGILWDIDENRQKLLQGHCNAISATCVSDDKRWIATADKGAESMVIIWDARSGTPIRTLFEPHREGVIAMAMSPDARFLATVGAACPQTLCIWDWTSDDKDMPIHCYPLGDYYEEHLFTNVRFDSSDARNIVVTSALKVTFIHWNRSRLEAVTPQLAARDFNHIVGSYTQSAFTPGHALAITGTVDGDLIVWNRSHESADTKTTLKNGTRSRKAQSAHSSARPRTAGVDASANKAGGDGTEQVARVGPAKVTTDGSGASFAVKATKIVRLHESSINVLVCTPSRVITGGSDGFVRFYDHHFRIADWFERFESGPITSLSFARSGTPRSASPGVGMDDGNEFGMDSLAYKTTGDLSSAQDLQKSGLIQGDEDDAPTPEFLVGTASATVILVEPRNAESTMYEIDADSWKAGRVLLCGQEGELHALAAHPSLPRFAMCGYGGQLHLWDYAERVRIAGRSFESKSLLVQCVEFSPDGKMLAVGFTNGVCQNH
eukprot:Opistho-2@48651